MYFLQKASSFYDFLLFKKSTSIFRNALCPKKIHAIFEENSVKLISRLRKDFARWINCKMIGFDGVNYLLIFFSRKRSTKKSCGTSTTKKKSLRWLIYKGTEYTQDLSRHIYVFKCYPFTVAFATDSHFRNTSGTENVMQCGLSLIYCFFAQACLLLLTYSQTSVISDSASKE